MSLEVLNVRASRYSFHAARKLNKAVTATAGSESRLSQGAPRRQLSVGVTSSQDVVQLPVGTYNKKEGSQPAIKRIPR